MLINEQIIVANITKMKFSGVDIATQASAHAFSQPPLTDNSIKQLGKKNDIPPTPKVQKEAI